MRRDLTADISAGIVIAVMLIPHSMAVALLAGLPPIIGLYAASVPPIVYALFGSSRYLNVGPVAVISLLTFAAVAPLARPGSAEYIRLTVLLMFMCGMIQLALGIIRAGFVVKFLSHAVVSGFTSAAAIIIAISQLDSLLGIDLEAHDSILHAAREISEQIQHVHPLTSAIGVGCILLLLGYRNFVRRLPPHLLLIAARFPASLLLVAGGILIVWLLRLDREGVAIVGSIPRGMPAPEVPPLDAGVMIDLLPAALTISLIGYVESISIAKTIAVRERERISSNHELNALGLANIAGSFFSGYPVTGSFSRTAVSYQAGARTQVAGAVAALMIILTLLLLTSLFFYLPEAVLAAIVIVAVSGLVNVREFREFYSIRSLDGATVAITFLATLTLGVELGILTGLIFSIGVFLWRSTDPHLIEVGYLESQGTFRNVERFPEGRTYQDILILRIDAPIYFANMEAVEQRIEQAVSERPGITHIIIDFTSVPDIDAVAVEALEGMIQNYRAAGVEVHLAGIHGHLRDVIQRAGWDERFGRETRHASVQLALESLGLMNRFTTGGPGQRIGLFGTQPMADILPSSLEDEEDEELRS